MSGVPGAGAGLARRYRRSEGFWALGEAIVDVVVARYPAAFDGAAVIKRR